MVCILESVSNVENLMQPTFFLPLFTEQTTINFSCLVFPRQLFLRKICIFDSAFLCFCQFIELLYFKLCQEAWWIAKSAILRSCSKHILVVDVPKLFYIDLSYFAPVLSIRHFNGSMYLANKLYISSNLVLCMFYKDYWVLFKYPSSTTA